MLATTLERDIVDILRTESTARRIVEQIALALSASLLIRHAPHDIADAFIASRLAGPWSGHFGTLPRAQTRRRLRVALRHSWCEESIFHDFRGPRAPLSVISR